MSDSVHDTPAAYRAPRTLPRYTWEDYAHWEGAWELVRGVPYAMTPSPFFPHNRVVSRLQYRLLHALDAHRQWVVVAETDWIVDEHTTLRPDLMVAREPVGDRWLTRAPHLVLEVLSPATEQKDRIDKKEICAEAGVPWFLLADPDTRVLEVYRRTPAGYEPHPFGESLTIPFEEVEVVIPVSDLWT